MLDRESRLEVRQARARLPRRAATVPVPEAQGDPFLARAAPGWPYLAWAVIWLLLVLALGLVSFERREL